MRRFHLFANVFLKAVILLSATVKVLHTQSCQPCNYKTVEKTISITVSACRVQNATLNQTGASIVVTGLTPGTTYFLAVACIDDCCGNTSTPVTPVIQHINTTALNVTWEGYPVEKTTVTTRPQVASNFKHTLITPLSVSLSWAVGEGRRSFFRVHWENKTNGVSGNQTTNGTVAVVEGLKPSTKYEFTVISVAEDNQTEGDPSASLPLTTYPAIPENIHALQRGNSSLTVSWNVSVSTNYNYRVFLGEWQKKTQKQQVEFTDLTAGTVYKCNVTSILGTDSTTSKTVELATEPNPPESVRITARNTTSLSLTWETPLLMNATAALSYETLHFASGGSSPQVVQRVSEGGRSVTLSSLISGTEYGINVSTIGPQNLSSSVVSLTGYTLPSAVTNLRSSSLSISQLKLEWDHPLGYQSYYSYRVQTVSPTNEIQNVSGNSANITGLQPGTAYNCSVTTTIPSASVQGQSEYISCNTKPRNVANLAADAVSTTEIRLTWSNPQDHKDGYTYEVMIVGDQNKNSSTSNNSTTFQNLEPGTNYTFRVFTKAVGETSQPSEISSFTKIGKPTNLAAVGTTTNMTVTWASPTGNVNLYIIAIYQDQKLTNSMNQSTNQTVVFKDLQPGKNYTITVTSRSGPFEGMSEVKNATYPNPPSDLEVGQYTNSSISLKWKRPVNMDVGEYSFIVTYGNTETSLTKNDSLTMTNLSSGTQYNITVKTVGPMDYKSTGVTASQYTRPYPASELKQLSRSTENMTVEWSQSDAKSGYSYAVAVSCNSMQTKPFTVSETRATIEALPSGAKCNVTVITQTAGGTHAPATSITAFTRPHPITGLVAITQNDSAVFLNWTRPAGFPPEGSYYITTNCSEAQPNRTVEAQTIYITGLSPGVSCFSTVYSLANGIAGDAVSISYSTKPPKVSPEVTVGSSASIHVTWTPAKGVDLYLVSLATAGVTIQNANISNNESTNQNLSQTFSNLLPATVYTVTITTVSGSFSELSDPVTIATYPTKPGEITVKDKTTDSIMLVWGSAPNMTNANFSYIVTYKTTGTNSIEIATTHTTQLLSGLSSGTSYSISVATVGPKDLKSEPVHLYPVTTKPKAVLSLNVTATSTSSITVKWLRPLDYKEGYKFRVTGSNGGNLTTNLNEYSFSSLTAGTSYSFSVQTLTADDTAGALVNTSQCTDASEVSKLLCDGPNLTEAMLHLTWGNPPGSNVGFEIQLGGTKQITPTCNTSCHSNFSGLAYNTQYNVSILTMGCGRSSSVKTISCKTGITVPPETSTEGRVTVTNIEFNKFTLELSPSLFNDTSGPVVSYGILLTSGSRSSSGEAKQYLTKTYSDLTAGQTTTYLAVVKEFQSTSRSVNWITEVVGSGGQWQDYVNGPLTAKGSYSYAIVIFTKLEVSSGLISTSQSYFSITKFHQTAIDLPENPAVIGGAIGGAVAGLVILLIIAMVLAVSLRRKKNKEDTPGVPIHSIRNKVSEPIKVEDYEAHYRRQRADSFCGFAEEFEDLKPVGFAQAKTAALAPENRAKNRYNNVLPYDNSRVKLSVRGSPFDDYINASNMPGYNSRKEFIAAQGPLPGTVNDFWRMIWEKNVHTVVMLTRCNEQGRVKCEEYWPPESKHYGDLNVTTTSEIPLEDWTIRDFDVRNVRTAETRSVRHFHFTAWPDHGVPETTELLINFRHLVREHMDQYSRHSPTVVHCSAGVGRTGTFIAIDRLIFQIERDGVVDIYGIIHDLRMHRTLMVQTEDQYVFLNQCAIDIIRSRTGTNVDLIYQNTAALTIYENFEPMKKSKNGYHKA